MAKKAGVVVMWYVLVIVVLAGVAGFNYFWQTRDKVSPIESSIGSSHQEMAGASGPGGTGGAGGEFAGAAACESSQMIDLGNQLADLRQEIDNLESQLGKSDPQVLEKRDEYIRLEMQHYALWKELGCEKEVLAIMFFYSNNPAYVFGSEKQNKALSELLDKYGPDKIKIYYIDSEFDLDSIKELKDRYGIETYPTLVINDRLYTGFKSMQDIETIMNKVLA